jgi:hypothetical protein
MICLLRYGGGCRFVNVVRTLAQCIARVQESCAALLYTMRSQCRSHLICSFLNVGNKNVRIWGSLKSIMYTNCPAVFESKRVATQIWPSLYAFISCAPYSYHYWSGISLLVVNRLRAGWPENRGSFPGGSIFLFTAVSGVQLPSIKWLRVISQQQSVWNVKLTTHFHLVPAIRACGAIPPLPHTF